jgi:hypothetical protein
VPAGAVAVGVPTGGRRPGVDTNFALVRTQIVRIGGAQCDEAFGFASRRLIESKNVVTSIST